MSGISVVMTIDEQDVTDLFSSLLDLTIEDDRRMASMLRLRYALSRADDGTWEGLDDQRIALWKKVSCSATVADEESELFRGYLTDIKVHFDQVLDSSWAEILAVDESVIMSIEEKIRDWPDKSDSDIATEIFNSYGLTPQVEATNITHEQAVGTIIQRESDIAFLRRLASRNGFECLVRNGEGVFKPPVLDSSAKPVLSVHFGTETNVISFDAAVRAQGPGAVSASMIDPVSKEIQTTRFDSSSAPALGSTTALVATAPPSGSPLIFLKHVQTLSMQEQEKRCAAAGEELLWFITSKIEVEAAQYGAILKRGDLVPVRGVSETLSGIYYVTAVTYRFEGERLLQQLTAIRNAAVSTSSDFTGSIL
jgi:hypothetical protein